MSLEHLATSLGLPHPNLLPPVGVLGLVGRTKVHHLLLFGQTPVCTHPTCLQLNMSEAAVPVELDRGGRRTARCGHCHSSQVLAVSQSKPFKELNKAKNAFVLKLRSLANLMESKAVFPLDWPVVVAAHIAENKL